MNLFDAHCHLDDEQFDPDRAQVIARMRENGIAECVCAGSDLASSARCIALAEKEKGVYAAAGVHPHEAEKAEADYLDRLADMLKNKKTVALGEIGLDYFYDLASRDAQKKALSEQVALAVRLDKPAVFHIRDAHGDMIDFFRGLKRLPRGVIHCFSGSAETAREYVRMGFYISFAGPLTFKKAPNLEKAALEVPEDRVLVETDSPYLSPEPLRGRRNEPANVRLVLNKMAQLRGKTPEEMAEITVRNARTVYGIREDA